MKNITLAQPEASCARNYREHLSAEKNSANMSPSWVRVDGTGNTKTTKALLIKK